ncbi:BTAD domain-containing putative transcriptional regulator [Actinokineospora sp.]|uniref:BTAD domain-containing putative transcriptional regulator n=1 Tax=Actinokineospora sp. TaxID=1872133 RepID=UPI0040378E8A
MVLFCVLGPVEAHAPGGVVDMRARKPVAVLATLLLHANAWVRTEQLIEATWPEQAAPTSADANLKTYIWQLRRALPDPVDGPRIDSRPGAYRLRVDPGELDGDRAEALAADARLALARGDGAAAAELFTAALELWRGRPFDGLPVDSGSGVVAWLEELHRELRESLADTYAGLGRVREAVDLLRALTDEDPLREGPWARWVRVLTQAGRPGAALAVHERARAVLIGELEAEPGPDLAAAHRAALRGAARTRPARRDLPRDVPDFTGRAAEVARLDALARAGGVPVAVIDGMPGVGKTALAVHLAHRLAPDYPDGQLHLDLRGALSPAVALDRLLRAVGVGDEDLPCDLAARAALWRAELVGRRLLIVLDDAVCAEQVRPLLPGSPGCLVLVTARGALPALDGVCAITLDPPAAEEAAELFRAVAGDWRADAEPDAVAEVVRLCGGLPAALRAAAARLRGRPTWTVGRLVARLAEDGGRAAELSAATARLAEYCRTLDAPPRRMLAVLAALSGEIDVAAAAEAAGTGEPQAYRVLEDLLDRHLLTQSAPDRYGLHPLVRDLACAAPRADRSESAAGPRVA